MPIRVTLRVRRLSPLAHEQSPTAKKQRTTQLPSSHIESEIANAVEEVNVKTEAIDEESTACSHGGSENAFCQSSYYPYLSQNHNAITSSTSTTSKQYKSIVLGTSYNTDLCTSKVTLEGNLDCLSNQESESHHSNTDFPDSELQSDKDLQEQDDEDEVARSSTAQEQSVEPFTFDNAKEKLKRVYVSWDERFQELVDFKKINGHANVPQKCRPLGIWVNNQRIQYRLKKAGKHSPLTSERRERLESIGFTFMCHTVTPWDKRFQELIEYKKINGHTDVQQTSRPLGPWVKIQRWHFRLLEEGKYTALTSERHQKLVSIGFRFKIYKKVENSIH